MRDKLLKEIEYALISSGVDAENVRSRLIIVLDKYEVQQRCTEIAIAEEDDISKYIRLFLINKRVAGRTERTLKSYKQGLEKVFNTINKSPASVTADDIKMFLAVRDVRDGVSKCCQQNTCRILSSFYQWMITEEYIIKNPMLKISKIKVPKIRKEAFSEIEIEQMRHAIGDDTRLELIFEMLLSTWCRVSEIAQMKISDISEDRTSVKVLGKGNKERICYINAKAKWCLDRYLKMRNDNNDYLFPNSAYNSFSGPLEDKELANKCRDKYWWTNAELVGNGHIEVNSIELFIRNLGKKAAVKKTHPHRFRRTGATFALRLGMPIEQVSKLLGHESIETTQIYLDISEQELSSAHKKYV